jgi:hypothetical protein
VGAIIVSHTSDRVTSGVPGDRTINIIPVTLDEVLDVVIYPDRRRFRCRCSKRSGTQARCTAASASSNWATVSTAPASVGPQTVDRCAIVKGCLEQLPPGRPTLWEAGET